MKNTRNLGFAAQKPRPGCTNSDKLPLDQFHRLFCCFNVKFSFSGWPFRSVPLNFRPASLAWITLCIGTIPSFASFMPSFRLFFFKTLVKDLFFWQETVKQHCSNIFSLMSLIQKALQKFFFFVEFSILEITSKRLKQFFCLQMTNC